MKHLVFKAVLLSLAVVLMTSVLLLGSNRRYDAQSQYFEDCSIRKSSFIPLKSPFWSEPEIEQFEYRAERAMEILLLHQKPRGLVVDMGAGSQNLRRFVPKTMSYKPVDLIQRLDGAPTSICNLNRLEFPFFMGEHVAAYFFLGSFEFILDKVNMLRMCRKRDAAVLMQYKINISGGRNGREWVTPLSMTALREAAKLAHYKLYVYNNDRDSLRKIEENNFLYFQPI